MFTPEQSHRIAQLANAGKPIDAIKEIRHLLNCGLKEAKDFYEAFVCGMFSGRAVKK